MTRLTPDERKCLVKAAKKSKDNLLKKFPEWLNETINEYREWYNDKRHHRRVHDMPTNLFYG